MREPFKAWVIRFESVARQQSKANEMTENGEDCVSNLLSSFQLRFGEFMLPVLRGQLRYWLHRPHKLERSWAGACSDIYTK